MRKIKYLQYGDKLTGPFIGSATNFFNKNAADPFSGLAKSILYNPTKAQFQFGAIGNTVGENQLGMDAFTTKTNLWKDKTLGGNTGITGFGDVKKKNPLISKVDGKALGNAALEMAPQLGEGIIKSIGGKEADNISGGEQVFSKFTDVAFKAALKTGNPYAIAGAAVLKGADWVNRFAGSTAKKQDTSDMSITGYGTQVNTTAGKKNTVLGSLSGKTDRSNSLTNKYDVRNLLAGNASQTALKNTQAGQISAQDIAAKSGQQLAGSNPYQNKFLSAKKGTKINPAKLRNLSNKVKKAQKGTKLSFNEWYKTIPSEKNDTTNYNLRRAYELAPQEQLDAFAKDPKAHLMSAYENAKTGEYEFVKSKDHKTIKLELDWYNSSDPEAVEFRKNYKLDTNGDYYKYVPVAKFQTGGKVNVIPEGALHKNLNHYEGELGDSVTSKGIPVITTNKEGEISQQAEIERNEVILHKKATEKIEELLKDYNKATDKKDKDLIAVNAGKFLTYELLENTIDNTNLRETI